MRAGLSLNRSLWLLTVLLTPLAVVGYYFLYVKLFQFSRSIGIFSCLLIAISLTRLDSYVSYSGGGLLQFAAFPFFLMGCIACIRRGGLFLCLLPFLFLAGAWLKLSFAVTALSVVLSVTLEQFPKIRLQSLSSWVIRPAAVALAFVAFYAALYFAFTSKGHTAADFQPTTGHYLFYLSYSMSSVLADSMSMLSALGRFKHLVRWSSVVLVMAAVSMGLLFWVLRRSTDNCYRAFLAGFSVVHVVFFTVLFAFGSLAPQTRHLWPASALLIPGLLSAIERSKFRSWRILAIVSFGAFGLYGVLFYAAQVKLALRSGRSSRLGIELPGRSQRLVRTVEALDRRLTGVRDVLYFNDPGLAILVPHVPVAFEPVMDPGKRVYSGAANCVIMVIDRSDTGNAGPDITMTFPSVEQWQRATIDSTDFYVGGCQTVPALGIATETR